LHRAGRGLWLLIAIIVVGSLKTYGTWGVVVADRRTAARAELRESGRVRTLFWCRNWGLGRKWWGGRAGEILLFRSRKSPPLGHHTP